MTDSSFFTQEFIDKTNSRLGKILEEMAILLPGRHPKMKAVWIAHAVFLRNESLPWKAGNDLMKKDITTIKLIDLLSQSWNILKSCSEGKNNADAPQG